MIQNDFQVLVVEDDDDHAELIIDTIQNFDTKIDITRLNNGEDAVQLLKNNHDHPDLILMDLKLPKLSGIEALKAIRNDIHLSSVPILILSTSHSQRDIQNAYANHANGYLVKPMDFEDLSKMVKDLFHYWARWNKTSTDTERTQLG